MQILNLKDIQASSKPQYKNQKFNEFFQNQNT